MWRKILVGAVILFFVALAYSVMSFATQERPISWTYSFNEYGTSPFSTRVFFKQLPDFFPEKTVAKLGTDEMPVVFWTNPDINDLNGDSLLNIEPGERYEDVEYFSRFNYISVSSKFESNHFGTNGLITHIYEGGHVQIYAFDYNSLLLERLGIKVGMIPDSPDSTPNLATQEVFYKGKAYNLRKTRSEEYFYDYPPQVDKLLLNDSGRVMGIKAKIGHGSISLFTTPHIFTNYDLLYVDHELAESLVSDLPIEDTYWSKNLNNFKKEDKGLLYFIFSYSTLKWAYFVLLFSLLFYFLLNLQRKQRAIPVIEAPKNLTLSFLQTISDLHYSQLDYHSILKKKMSFLRNQIKSNYHLHQKEIDELYIDQLAKRSKIKKETLTRLFDFYDQTIQQKSITKAEFESLCNLFQLFKI